MMKHTYNLLNLQLNQVNIYLNNKQIIFDYTFIQGNEKGSKPYFHPFICFLGKILPGKNECIEHATRLSLSFQLLPFHVKWLVINLSTNEK